MDSMISVSPGYVGVLVCLLWALIGIMAGLVASRYIGGKPMRVFNLIIGIASGVIGGFLSVQFIGDTPTMHFLISILGSAFLSSIVMWFVGLLYQRFSRKD